MMPTVSVVIPAHNAAPYLAAALHSVLCQERSSIEVVVVDDGSTDNTPRVLAGFGPPVRCVRQRNRGVAAARNRGIAESRGRLIAFLDADDTWLPGKLSRQLAALAARPESGVCHSAFRVVPSDTPSQLVVRYRRRASVLEDLLMRGNVVGTPSTVVAVRELVLAEEGFDPELSLCADWDLWVRLARVTSFCYVDEPLVQYRRHGENMSRDIALLERDSLRVLEKAFSRADLPPSLSSRRTAALARNYSVLAGSYYQAGRSSDALRCFLRAVRLRPLEILRPVTWPWRQGRRVWGGLTSYDQA